MIYDKLVEENNNKYNLNQHNDILITNEEASILSQYDFDYKKYSSLSELSFDIEEFLKIDFEDDLEYALINITERNYYNNTNR